jgi:hypothetical protein
MLDRFDNISHAQERKLRLMESNMSVYQTHAKKNANLAAALEGMSYLPPGDARPSRDFVEGLPSPDCEIEVVLRNAHSLGSEELKAAEHAFKTAMSTIFGGTYGLYDGYVASLGCTESAKDWRAKTALAHAKVQEVIAHESGEALRLGQAGGAFFQISITHKM